MNGFLSSDVETPFVVNYHANARTPCSRFYPLEISNIFKKSSCIFFYYLQSHPNSGIFNKIKKKSMIFPKLVILLPFFKVFQDFQKQLEPLLNDHPRNIGGSLELP